MKPAVWAVFLLLSLESAPVSLAAPPISNPELEAIAENDQVDRRNSKDIDWSVVSKRDEERRRRVLEILVDGGVRTADDYYAAALVFQHGETADDAKLAHSLATVATRIAPNEKKYRWLAAASWDRYMMRLKKPQWFGTQLVRDKATGNWILYAIDEAAVTDAIRTEHGVRTLAESKERISKMNER
jgi:hypothetical protein